MLHNKTIIHLGVSEGGGYLPIYLHFGEQLLNE